MLSKQCVEVRTFVGGFDVTREIFEIHAPMHAALDTMLFYMR